MLTDNQRAAIIRIAQAVQACDEGLLAPLIPNMSHRSVEQGLHLFEMGQKNNTEYFVLSGVLRSYVLNPEGEEITLCISVGPCVFPPSISRSIGGISQVNGDALLDATVVEFETQHLMQLMICEPEIRRWGDSVMQAELTRRTERELSLATKTAKQRLEQFRTHHPALEDSISHAVIASFLGITPVSLSRIRNSSS